MELKGKNEAKWRRALSAVCYGVWTLAQVTGTTEKTSVENDVIKFCFGKPSMALSEEHAL